MNDPIILQFIETLVLVQYMPQETRNWYAHVSNKCFFVDINRPIITMGLGNIFYTNKVDKITSIYELRIVL